MRVGGVCRAEGGKWDNCNGILNKMYFLKNRDLHIEDVQKSRFYCINLMVN